MMTRNVLVVGAGELGLCMLEALVKHERKAHIAVLMRQATLDSGNPEKQRTSMKIQEMGVTVEAADVVLASVSDLAEIFGKYDTVVSCSGMALPSGTQKKLAEAALEGKVKRYFPWQFGMDYDIIGEGSSQDLFDEQLEVRRILRGQSETEWVIVSTGLFMSFLFLAEFGVVDFGTKTVRGLGTWDNRITVTTPQDIGTVTAVVILDPQDIETGVVYTAGDTISYLKLADMLDEYYGVQFNRELWDAETLKKQMEEDGGVMVKYRDTFAQGRGVAWDMEQTVNRKRGIGMTDVGTYMRGLDVKLGADEKSQ